MFATLSDRLADTFKNLRGKGRLSEADIDATAREIRIALLEADVALPVVKEFVGAVKERARGEEVSGALNPAQQIVKIVNEELVTILGGETRRLRYAKTGPTVIMLAGLQGAGKTTLAAKLALWLKEQGKTPDAGRGRPPASQRRPAAAGQRRARRRTRSSPPSPATASATRSTVARASIEEAKRKLHDVVIIDTAGRLGVDAELMQQAADIRDAVQPDEVLFVVDAMIGQDAVTTAQAFLDGVGYDGVVLTKLDGDARGGAALSIALDHRQAGHVRLQRREDDRLRPVPPRPDGLAHPRHGRHAHPDRAGREGVRLRAVAEGGREARRPRAASRSRTSSSRCMQIRKLGSMTKIMGMLPGMGQFRDQLENFDEREIDRIQAIIQSMTPAERDNPKIIDGSRRARIAEGSGRQVSDVNQLVDRFFEARKMMESMAKGGGMPGMPGMPGMRRRQARRRPAGAAGKGKKGKKRVSGNPAKAAQQKAAQKTASERAGRQPLRQPRRRRRRLREGGRRSSTCPRTSPSSSK